VKGLLRLGALESVFQRMASLKMQMQYSTFGKGFNEIMSNDIYF